MQAAKIIGTTFAGCLVLLALLYLIADARRHESDRTNRHTHWECGCRIECCEPNCPRDE